MPRPSGPILLVVSMLLALVGCAKFHGSNAWPPPPPPLPPDAVALEIFFVRFPAGDPLAGCKLWQEVDEQPFSADLRQRLATNGFRVGLLAGQVPETLAKLLDMKEAVPAAGEQKATLDQLEAKPRVVLRHLQTRSGARNEVVASGIYERLPVLVSEAGELRGQTYTQAQGLFAVSADPQADGRVRVDLVPELHHDQAKQHWVGDQAMWRLESSRPKRVFDDLKLSTMLPPGGMMLLASVPNRPGSLGHYFFTEGEGKDGPVEQKLLVLRICQTQHNELNNPRPLSLGE